MIASLSATERCKSFAHLARTSRPRDVGGNLFDSPHPVSREQLAQAVQRCTPRLLAVARRFLVCEAECADAVQDAFVLALRQLTSFRGLSRLETWLHRIVINACLMRLRTRSRQPTISLNELSLDLEDASLHRCIAEEETQGIVRDALDRMAENQRAVIQLRFFDGFNTAETAQVLDTSTSTVKTRLHRSCRTLRRLLEEKLGGEP